MSTQSVSSSSNYIKWVWMYLLQAQDKAVLQQLANETERVLSSSIRLSENAKVNLECKLAIIQQLLMS